MRTKSTEFNYEDIKNQENQTYRFIVDFLKVKAGYSAGNLNCGLIYAYTDNPLTNSVNIGIVNAESFRSDSEGGQQYYSYCPIDAIL